MASKQPIPVVDLFAGPGGLGEGFSRVGGVFNQVFKTVISIEKDPHAIQTLRLRAFYRAWVTNHEKLPEAYLELLKAETLTQRESALTELHKLPEWESAKEEVRHLELGKDNEEIRSLIRKGLKDAKSWVLIGGPPCQAYSLVGRSRMQNHDGLKADYRHHLYKEYLAIIREFEPAIFVMENVKGLNTAKVNGKPILPVIIKDLERAGASGYTLYSLAPDKDLFQAHQGDFLLRTEEYGVPQTRHRVIIVGVRNDIQSSPQKLEAFKKVSLKSVIGELPQLEGLDSAKDRGSYSDAALGASYLTATNLRKSMPGELSKFIRPRVRELDDVVLNHQARSHMSEDLKRYKWWATRAEKDGKSPSVFDAPVSLRPAHANLQGDEEGAVFVDRFKVQLPDRPCGTVTSHISKDGHYYIHYDPSQARSFSVREAARVQTFPDDYFFMGNKTQQYHQVGNAVPPYLAYQIGLLVSKALKKVHE